MAVHEQLRSVLVHFPAKFLRESTIREYNDTSSTWVSTCQDDSLVIIPEIIICLTLDSAQRNVFFWLSGTHME